MKNRIQKTADLIKFIKGLSKSEKDKALINLLEWQMIEIGEDIHADYDEDDEKIVDIYWSSCGESILE